MNHLELADFWNAAHLAWANGDPRPAELDRWFDCYSGTGANAPVESAMAEPWIGDLSSSPEVVAMGIHLGGSDPSFHLRGGLWSQAIDDKHGGAYSDWAATGPYFGSAWESVHGVNANSASRQRFLSAWTGIDLSPSQVVDFSLYPWQTADWKRSAFTPDPDLLREFVLEPIASAGARWAFGFGKDWWDIITALDLPILDRLGDGGRPYPTQVDHRRWLIAEGPNGLRIAAMRLDSMPIPPAQEETEDLRRVLETGPAGENRQRRIPPSLEADLSARLRELDLSQVNLWRLWNALDEVELSIDAWQEAPSGGGVTLDFDGETVVQVNAEWADFLTKQPSDSAAMPDVAGVHRLPLPTQTAAPARTARKEAKPLGMCLHCFNVLNPDGTCPMECDQ